MNRVQKHLDMLRENSVDIAQVTNNSTIQLMLPEKSTSENPLKNYLRKLEEQPIEPEIQGNGLSVTDDEIDQLIGQFL